MLSWSVYMRCDYLHLVYLQFYDSCTCAQVLGRIVGMGDAAQDPADFPTSPALAAPKALAAAGLQQSAVDYWEVNEAFCVVDMVNQRLLGLDPARYVKNVSFVLRTRHLCGHLA